MKVDAILCGDIHLRETQPTCRTDDFWETQRLKLEWLSMLQKKYNCPVYHSGDLFDNWKPSPRLLTFAFDYLPHQFYTIAGNHDLPQHNIKFIEKSGLFTLYSAGKIELLDGVHWEMEPESKDYIDIKGRKILIRHIMVSLKKEFWQPEQDKVAAYYLKKEKQADLILTGHNHKKFVLEHKGKVLVNPGSLFRLKADQVDHEPAVFLYDAKNNKVKEVKYPIDKKVVSREKLEQEKKDNEKVTAFIERLRNDIEFTFDFKQNIENAFSENNISEKLKNIIREAMDVVS